MSAPVEYHWVIVLHYTAADERGRAASGVSSQSGTITIDGPARRNALFDQIATHARTQIPATATPGPIVFFSIEPNVLGGAS